MLIESNQCHQPANETQSGGAIRDILQGKQPDSCRKVPAFLGTSEQRDRGRGRKGGTRGENPQRLRASQSLLEEGEERFQKLQGTPFPCTPIG